MALCTGKSKGHCCWLEGVVCQYLRDDGPQANRQWVCTLREQLGSWVEVHASPVYVSNVKPKLDRLGLPNCGDWPRKNEVCNECGAKG